MQVGAASAYSISSNSMSMNRVSATPRPESAEPRAGEINETYAAERSEPGPSPQKAKGSIIDITV